MKRYLSDSLGCILAKLGFHSDPEEGNERNESCACRQNLGYREFDFRF
jgi:hypothetical protein